MAPALSVVLRSMNRTNHLIHANRKALANLDAQSLQNDLDTEALATAKRFYEEHVYPLFPDIDDVDDTEDQSDLPEDLNEVSALSKRKRRPRDGGDDGPGKRTRGDNRTRSDEDEPQDDEGEPQDDGDEPQDDGDDAQYDEDDGQGNRNDLQDDGPANNASELPATAPTPPLAAPAPQIHPSALPPTPKKTPRGPSARTGGNRIETEQGGSPLSRFGGSGEAGEEQEDDDDDFGDAGPGGMDFDDTTLVDDPAGLQGAAQMHENLPDRTDPTGMPDKGTQSPPKSRRSFVQAVPFATISPMHFPLCKILHHYLDEYLQNPGSSALNAIICDIKRLDIDFRTEGSTFVADLTQKQRTHFASKYLTQLHDRAGLEPIRWIYMCLAIYEWGRTFKPEERDEEGKTPPGRIERLEAGTVGDWFHPFGIYTVEEICEFVQEARKTGQRAWYLQRRLPPGALIHLAWYLTASRLLNMSLRQNIKENDIDDAIGLHPNLEKGIAHLYSIGIDDVMEDGVAKLEGAIMEAMDRNPKD